MSMRTTGMVGQLKRLLSKPHPLTVEAVLWTRETSPLMLGRYERDRINAELAEEICATVDEYAQLHPGTQGLLVLFDVNGKELGSRPVEPASAPVPEDEAARFATRGDNMAQAQNAQRHLEVMSRQLFQQQALSMQCLRDIIKDQNAQLTEQRRIAADAQAQAAQAAQQLAEWADETPMPEGAEAQTAAMQVQVMELLKPLLPAIAARLLAPPAAAVVKS